MGVPRKVVQIAAASASDTLGHITAVLFAVADDGSVWRYDSEGGPAWWRHSPLPDAEACGAKFKEIDADVLACRLGKGHRENHWNGRTRWE